MAAYAAVEASDVGDLSRYTAESRDAFLTVYNEAAVLSAELTGKQYTALSGARIAQLAAELKQKCAELTTLQTYESCISAAELSFDGAACFNNDYVTVEITPNANFPNAARVGTGCHVKISYPDGTMDYEAVLVGDIDGNGWYDSTDAYFVKLVVSGLIPLSALSEGQKIAADCNHDTAINQNDVALLERAGLLYAQIDPDLTPYELAANSAYLEYIELIDQSIEAVEIEEETVAVTAPDASAGTALSTLWLIIVRAFATLKGFFLSAFSFLPH